MLEKIVKSCQREVCTREAELFKMKVKDNRYKLRLSREKIWKKEMNKYCRLMVNEKESRKKRENMIIEIEGKK